VRGLDTTGGWAQLKFKPAQKYELNAVFGQDSSQASEVRRFPTPGPILPPHLSEIEAGWRMFCIIELRPGISVEYRRLQTFSLTGASENANHINLAIGFFFSPT